MLRDAGLSPYLHFGNLSTHEVFAEVVAREGWTPLRLSDRTDGARAGLAAAGAVSTITVFGNGLTGPGAMGFQPGIFREKAGEPAWSPLWDHFTVVWSDPAAATLLVLPL